MYETVQYNKPERLNEHIFKSYERTLTLIFLESFRGPIDENRFYWRAKPNSFIDHKF